MALIKCPECKKKVSDQCSNCPHCGYSIQNHVQQQIAVVNSDEVLQPESPSKKPFYKKPWVWIVTGVALIVIIIGIIFLLTHNTKPKLDKEGNPVFVELTNEVYTNAKKYKGYHINIKGQVFQVMSDNGSVKAIQVWIDPDTCEQNMMIYYNTDVEVKQGDYISCSGYIDSVEKYQNAFGATMYAPSVYSSDLKKATYIDVMAPTIETITPVNLKKESYGYSITIEKIEFSEIETRIYATITNNGNGVLYTGEPIIIQNGKQYRSTPNYTAGYEEISYEIVKGASSSGIIVFPAINVADFELSFDLHSNNFDEMLEAYCFLIKKEASTIKPTGTTPPTIQTETSKNRNQEAVSEAINVANYFFPTNRLFVKHVLLNPSLEQKFEAFSESEVDYAINTADINWALHASTTLAEYSDSCGAWISPNDLVHNWLENYSSFTDDELSYAINNCNIDWNFAAKENVSEFADKNNITREQVAAAMLIGGYTNAQVEYGINNSDFDWSLQVEDYIYVLLDQRKIKYTNCPNCYWIYGVYEICPFCSAYTDIYETSTYTKEQIIKELKNVGFTDIEIGKALQYYSDSYFYNEDDYKKP